MSARCHWSTVFYLRKGSNTPEATSDLARKNEKRLKGRHHPGLQSNMGTEDWRTHTHTHTPRAMWGKGGVEFLHCQFQCPLLNFLTSAVFEPWLRIHNGDKCTANIPRSSTLTTSLWMDREIEMDSQPTLAVVSFFYLDSFSHLYYFYSTWRYYYTKFMKNNGKGNNLQQRIYIAGKRSTGRGKLMGKGICITGLIYTSPTKDWPWTGIQFTSLLLIKRKGPKGRGVCVCICLCVSVRMSPRCDWSTVFYLQKGSKTPEATSDLARKTTKRLKGRHERRVG